MVVWIVMRTNHAEGPLRYETLGVFSTRELAVARCNGVGIRADAIGDYIFGLTLDRALPDEPVNGPPWIEIFWVKDGQLLGPEPGP